MLEHHIYWIKIFWNDVWHHILRAEQVNNNSTMKILRNMWKYPQCSQFIEYNSIKSFDNQPFLEKRALAILNKSFIRCYTNLSSLPSTGFLGSGCLFKVLQPFKPFTDAPVTEACRAEPCKNLRKFWRAYNQM